MSDPAHDCSMLFSDGVMAVVHATSYPGIRVGVILEVFVDEMQPTSVVPSSLEFLDFDAYLTHRRRIHVAWNSSESTRPVG